MTDPAQAVFVIGAPRSGTSALAWALAEHDELWTSAESDWLGFLFEPGKLREVYRRGTARGGKHWLSKHDVSFEEWAAAIGRGVDGLYRERSGDLTWIEQTPAYALHAETLAALFPGARFIHLLRDGEQVVHSLLHSGFDVDMARSFRRACHGWARHVEGALAAEAALPGRVLRVRHDRLVRSPDEVCTDVLAFLGFEPHPGPAELLRRSKLNSSFPDEREASWERRPSADWSLWRRFQFDRIAGPSMARAGFR